MPDVIRNYHLLSSQLYLPNKTFCFIEIPTKKRSHFSGSSNHPFWKTVRKASQYVDLECKNHRVKAATKQDGAVEACWANNPEAGRSKLPPANSCIVLRRKTFIKKTKLNIIEKKILSTVIATIRLAQQSWKMRKTNE